MIAVNASASEQGPAAVFGTNDPAGIEVPAGRWYVLTYDKSGGVHRSADATTLGNGGHLTPDQASKRIDGDAAAQADGFETLLRFAVTDERAYLLSLDVLTAGFSREALSTTTGVDPAQARELRLAAGELDAQRQSAASAADLLANAPLVRAPMSGPAPGLFDILRAKIEDPINAQARAKKARQDVALAFGRMTLQQQRDAFTALVNEEHMPIDATDSAAFVERLERGDFDNDAAQIRNRLQNNADYQDFFDLRNIETAQQEGAALVKDGADFYGKSIKKALDKTFPGIGQGWDMVETLEKRLQQAKTVLARAQTLKDYLTSHGVTVTAAEAEQLATEINGSGVQLATAGAGDEVASIQDPTGSMAGAEGEAKRIVVQLPYSNPHHDDLALRCKYTGPASADASTQATSDANGTAVFTFDAGYAPKSGKYAVDCSLDTYLVHSTSFAYVDSRESAMAEATVLANPLLSKDQWCSTPQPSDGSLSNDFIGGQLGDAFGEVFCDIYKTAEASGHLETLLTILTTTPEAQPPLSPVETPLPATPTPCVPTGSGAYNPVGGLAGGSGC